MKFLRKDNITDMKKKAFGALKFTYCFSCFFVLFSITAHAYIDPSAVTYIIQGVAGILIAVGAAITVFRHKIKAAWRKWYYGKVSKKNKKK